MGKKTALITGASGGIGQAVAREVSSLGYKVILQYYQNQEKAEQLANEIKKNGREAFCFQANLSSPEEVDQLYDQIEEIGEAPELLIYTAGTAKTHLIQDLSNEEWDALVGVGLSGCVYCARRNAPSMIRAGAGQMIFFSSMWGLTGASCETAYSAVKAGVIGFTKALAKELGPSGIRVNCVAPGATNTDMLSAYSEEDLKLIAEETALGYIASPEEIAKTVTFLIGPGGQYYTGQVLSPNGGMVI